MVKHALDPSEAEFGISHVDVHPTWDHKVKVTLTFPSGAEVQEAEERFLGGFDLEVDGSFVTLPAAEFLQVIDYLLVMQTEAAQAVQEDVERLITGVQEEVSGSTKAHGTPSDAPRGTWRGKKS